jgi:hypothetical protein
MTEVTPEAFGVLSATDPDALAHLEELDAQADTAADNAEIARLNYEDAAAARGLADSALCAAETALSELSAAQRNAEAKAIAMRRALGLIRTATGYRTVAEMRAAAAAAQQAGVPLADALSRNTTGGPR